jgi:thioredoxin reductase
VAAHRPGAAGLAGAVALVRSRRSLLVVDAGDPRNAPASGVHNFLTRDGSPPAKIYAAGLTAGAAINADLAVQDAQRAARAHG